MRRKRPCNLQEGSLTAGNVPAICMDVPGRQNGLYAFAYGRRGASYSSSGRDAEARRNRGGDGQSCQGMGKSMTAFKNARCCVFEGSPMNRSCGVTGVVREQAEDAGIARPWG